MFHLALLALILLPNKNKIFMKETSSPHFLDKQTFFALALVFISWILWERHIREKYRTDPSAKKEQIAQNIPSQRKDIKTAPSQKFKQHIFEDEDWKVQFSSEGLGIKSVSLKKFLDRKENIIQFNPEGLFFEIREKEGAVPFKVRKVSQNQYQAEGVSGQTSYYVSMRIFPYYIDYHIDFRSKKSPSFFIKTVDIPKKGAEGMIQGLLSGAEPGMSLFAQNSKTTKRFLYADDQEGDEWELAQVNALGLGTRYFGYAFSNQSARTPHLYFKEDLNIWEVFLNFSPPVYGEMPSIKYRVFFGPKSLPVLKKIDSQLVSWVNFGFLSWLAKFILFFLELAFSISQNWGFSIILLTLFVRILLFPLNLSAYRSMKVMKDIQPEMMSLRKKFSDDPKKMNQEILNLMKRKKAQPLGGCLPMLLQFPIFFALYRVLAESFELYKAPFFGWIQDLSVKDPFYVLPVLMGLSMYFQQKITPTNMDPAQEKVLKFLPIIFTFFMINLPSGLTLYIFVSTLFGLAQQYYFLQRSDLKIKEKQVVKKIKKKE